VGQVFGISRVEATVLALRIKTKNIGENGAPGGTRTPDLLVRRGNTHYTRYNTNTQEPIESAREGKSSRLLLYRLVPRSRTITRTISARLCSTLERGAKWRSLHSLRLKSTAGDFCIAAQVVAKSLRLIQSESMNWVQRQRTIAQKLRTKFGWMKFSSTHNSRPPVFLASAKSSRPTRKHVALKCSTAQFWCIPVVFPSDCLPHVLSQVFESAQFAGECPRSVRVLESCAHAS
jgi:hypothetical protein